MSRHAANCLSIRVDTTVIHLDRWTADGVERDLGELDWEPFQSGSRAVVRDGLAVERDTQAAGDGKPNNPPDYRVTIGPEVLWKLDPDADLVAWLEAELQVPRTPRRAPLFRVDVACDLQASTPDLCDSLELEELRRLRACAEEDPRWNAAFGWHKGGCVEFCWGKAGKANQWKFYDKTHRYHWENLARYAEVWEHAGWPGVLCRCGATPILEMVCPHCMTPAEPHAIMRAELHLPRRWCGEVSDFSRMRRWVAAPPSKGRATLIADLPARWQAGIMSAAAAWDDLPVRPKQRRGIPTEAAAVTHFKRLAGAAESRAATILRTTTGDRALAAEAAARVEDERRAERVARMRPPKPRRR